MEGPNRRREPMEPRPDSYDPESVREGDTTPLEQVSEQDQTTFVQTAEARRTQQEAPTQDSERELVEVEWESDAVDEEELPELDKE